MTPLERYREKLARDARREEQKRGRSFVAEWFSSPFINWFLTVVLIGIVSFYYENYRQCIDQTQQVMTKSSALIEEIKARLSVDYVFYQKARSMDEFVELRKQGADVQNAVLGTSDFFYLYRQLLREQHGFVNGETVDAYLEAASGLIFPGKPFRQAMSDSAILLSTDLLPTGTNEAAAFAEIRDLAFRSIQLLLFQANFIETQLTKPSCTPSSILWNAFLGTKADPTIQPPAQLPPPAALTKVDVYAVAPIPELAPPLSPGR
ncbi:hypothetical protein [Ancylobacter terrae]|uniref:hypothetical protein n=1 Tax=Ancylobacter sp. sgz301288 TaxID=3342077 RepID=UPI0038596B95